jgi:hypothetical protein
VADVLYQLAHSDWRIANDRPIPDLVTAFAKELKPILEQCVVNRGLLPTVFPYGGSREREVIRFVIAALGKVGHITSVPVLRALIDDTDFGRDAIQAIELIQKGAVSPRLIRAP